MSVCYNVLVNKNSTQSLKTIKRESENSMKKTTNKTTFETINNTLAIFNQYFTVQNNEVNEYARICFTDDYTKDNYKLFKDFAVYYNKKDAYRISIADNTLIDCKAFKESHEKSEKTRALEFTVKSEDLVSTIYEILAQRLMQSNKKVDIKFKTTTVRKARTAKAK